MRVLIDKSMASAETWKEVCKWLEDETIYCKATYNPDLFKMFLDDAATLFEKFPYSDIIVAATEYTVSFTGFVDFINRGGWDDECEAVLSANNWHKKDNQIYRDDDEKHDFIEINDGIASMVYVPEEVEA